MISIIVAISALLVYLDATRHKIGKIPDQEGLWNLSAGLWATATLMLWIVALPAYLLKRSSLIAAAETHPQEPANITIPIALLSIIVVIAVKPNIGTIIAAGAGAAPPAAMFDLSIPTEKRLEMARAWVVGSYKWEESPIYANYTISSNGTWSSNSCLAYGEVRERKFTSNGSGAWTVKEERYTDTGKLVYLIKMSQPEKLDTELAIDRDQGLMFVTVKGVKPVFKKGTTTFCGT